MIEMADIFVDLDHGLERDRGYPPHPERFEQHGFDLVELLNSDGGA